MKRLLLLLTGLLLSTSFIQAQNPGDLDLTFNAGGVNYGEGANSSVFTTVLQPDGKILIGGNFTSYNGMARNRIARLNSDGSLDPSFNPGTGANNEVFTTVIQTDGKILIGGEFTNINGIPINRIARLNSDGSLDASFNPGTGPNTRVESIVIQSDGKIIIGGFFTSFNGISSRYIARLNVNGSLDQSFSIGTGADFIVYSLVLQDDGKILVGGAFTSFNGTNKNRIARLNSDGSLDNSFNNGSGANSSVRSISIRSDGKILIGGFFTSFDGISRRQIALLEEQGSLDTSFAPGLGANNAVLRTVILDDGKILIGGLFSTYNGIERNRIARINSEGSLDISFNPGTGLNADLWSIALQSDGKVLIGGDFTSYNEVIRIRLARIFSTDDEQDSEGPFPDIEHLKPINAQCQINFDDLIIPTATDNVDGTIEGITDENFFPIIEPGNYTITWIFTDEAGNNSTQEQEILLTSGIGVLICVDDQIVETEDNSCTYTHLDTSWDVVPTATCSDGISILSDFSENLEGWTRRIPSDPNSTVVYMSTGGNPGAFARFNEPGQGTVDYFAAPMKFKGDKSIFYGGMISFDLRSNRSTTNLSNYLLIAGNGITLQSKAGRINNIWTNYEISLLPIDWIVFGTNTQASEAQLKNVLSNINDLSVRADWINGVETVDLDNFQMRAFLAVSYELTGATEGTGMSLGGVVFQAGQTLVTWKQSDGKVSFISCSFTVKVEDKTAPFPDLEELPALFGDCIIELEAPTATDNCSGVITGITTSPLVFTERGIYSIDWIFEDSNGNKSTQNQVVTIEDIETPVIMTNGDQNVNADEGICSAVVPIYATATDNCEVGEPIGIRSDGEDLEAPYSVGITTITWNVTDINGNEATEVIQTVTVMDIIAPIWGTQVNALDRVVVCDQGQLIDEAQALAPEAIENCGFTISKTTGIFVPSEVQGVAGSFTNTWIATDSNGNESEVFTQVIKVEASSIDASASSTPVPLNQAAKLSAAVMPNLADISVTFVVTDESNVTVYSETVLTDASGIATANTEPLSIVGVYKVMAVIGSGCASSIAYIPVYDASGSFVTGGGWIQSPEGAFAADPTLVGKANFGFVSKYRKGSNQVDGNTEFQFNAGGLNFKSTMNESGSLVISGKRATYRGTGTLNGQPEYKFVVVAIDGHWNGQNNPDQFRIKISTIFDEVIYDNQMGSSENTENATVIGGGSIVIHEPAKGKQSKRLDEIDELSEINTSSDEQNSIIAPESNRMKIYPNPAIDITNVLISLMEPSTVDIRIFDTTGRLIFSEETVQEESFVRSIQLASLSNGLYYVVVKVNHQYLQSRLIKK